MTFNSSMLCFSKVESKSNDTLQAENACRFSKEVPYEQGHVKFSLFYNSA